MRHAVARGLECVGVETETASGDIAKAVLDWVEAVREERRQPAPDELFDVGATYGEALRAALGWSWKWLVHDGGRALAIVADDEARAHLPITYVRGQLGSTRDCTAILLFNMLSSGPLPPSKPGMLSILS